MFRDSVQTGIISIFSSTGSHPLELWHAQSDPSLPVDSHITLISDVPVPSPSESEDQNLEYVQLEGESENGARALCHPVLHLQSPTLASTFIRCPRSAHETLGIELSWLHIQLRDLGGRPFAFEVGVSNQSGRQAVIRCATFQTEPELVLTPQVPLLLVPLRLPSKSSSTLTPWSTLSFDLRATCSAFGASELLPSPPPPDSTTQDSSRVRAIRFAAVDYVKIYANCRLRRVWLSAEKEREGVRRAWELELYG